MRRRLLVPLVWSLWAIGWAAGKVAAGVGLAWAAVKIGFLEGRTGERLPRGPA